MFHFDHWPESEPRYPDRLAVAAPRGTRAALKQRAEAERVTVPELLRRIIAGAVGVTPPHAGAH